MTQTVAVAKFFAPLSGPPFGLILARFCRSFIPKNWTYIMSTFPGKLLFSGRNCLMPPRHGVLARVFELTPSICVDLPLRDPFLWTSRREKHWSWNELSSIPLNDWFVSIRHGIKNRLSLRLFGIKCSTNRVPRYMVCHSLATALVLLLTPIVQGSMSGRVDKILLYDFQRGRLRVVLLFWSPCSYSFNLV